MPTEPDQQSLGKKMATCRATPVRKCKSKVSGDAKSKPDEPGPDRHAKKGIASKLQGKRDGEHRQNGDELTLLPPRELCPKPRWIVLWHQHYVCRSPGLCAPRPPNRWRVSGERRAEGDERVRCTRVLGNPMYALASALLTRPGYEIVVLDDRGEQALEHGVTPVECGG